MCDYFLRLIWAFAWFKELFWQDWSVDNVVQLTFLTLIFFEEQDSCAHIVGEPMSNDFPDYPQQNIGMKNDGTFYNTQGSNFREFWLELSQKVGAQLHGKNMRNEKRFSAW